MIPIKDFSEAKTRIKASLPVQHAHLVENIIQVSFFYLVEILNNLKHPFGVVSPSKSIINKSEELGAIFTFQDSGTDLNDALTYAAKKLPQDQPILVVMPDLPFITQDFLQTFLKKIQNEDILIVPSISGEQSMGTALLYLKTPKLVSFMFGMNSSLKFRAEAENRGLVYRTLQFDPYARDLDTLEDVLFLKNHLGMVYEPSRFAGFLGQII